LIVNIGFPIWNFGLVCIIAIDNFKLASTGFLPFVILDDIFRCCGWLLPRTFFITFASVWSGAGYSESQVETDVVALQLETSIVALELEMDAANLELETSAASLYL
jgi:hypothetical protein